MKILTAHQPQYAFWLGLLHKIMLCDTFCIFDDCQMSGDGWENRNRIKGPNGEFWLTVPIKSKGYRDKKLYKLEIDNTQRWRDKHKKSIINCYQKAKYFSEYMPFFNALYSQEWELLTELNEHFLRWLLTILDIKVELVRASNYDFEGQKSDLVLDMCRKLGADMYIFGSQGIDYADREAFDRAGIKIYFQQYECAEYNQLWGSFVPKLSIIDLLMNEGAEKAKQIIQSGNITREGLINGY